MNTRREEDGSWNTLHGRRLVVGRMEKREKGEGGGGDLEKRGAEREEGRKGGGELVKNKKRIACDV